MSLLALLFFLVPLDMLGVYIGGKLIMPGILVSAIIAIGCVGQLLSGGYRWIGLRERWTLCFAGFLSFGLLSILISPYSVREWPRGITQIVGITVMILTCVAFLNEVRTVPARFARYVKLCVVILGVFAIFAVVQSFVDNVLQRPELVDLSFINNYDGGNGKLIWRSADYMGPLLRASSLASEVSHFVVILGIATGPALLRLGLLGRQYQSAIARVVPRWAAVAIMLGYLVALSLVGYFLLTVIAASLWVVSRRLEWKTVAGAAVSALAIVGFVYVAVASSLPELVDKVMTVAVVGSPGTPFNYDMISALDLALNVSVMEHNISTRPLSGVGLGGHPITYEDLNPGLGRLPLAEMKHELNKEDANSLLVRLLSESGIFGTVLYISGLLVVLGQARRVILERIEDRAETLGDPDGATLLVLAIGLTASLAGESAAYLARTGVYYGLPLWLSIALVCCVPTLLKKD